MIYDLRRSVVLRLFDPLLDSSLYDLVFLCYGDIYPCNHDTIGDEAGVCCPTQLPQQGGGVQLGRRDQRNLFAPELRLLSLPKTENTSASGRRQSVKRGSIAEVDSVELNKKFKESQEELNGNKNLRGVIQLMQAPSRWVLQRRDSKTNKIRNCQCTSVSIEQYGVEECV